MDQPKKKILITGASGFIGRNLFLYLSRREDLDVFGTYKTRRFLESSKLLRADILEEKQIREIISSVRPDVLVHAAAVTTGAADISARPEIFVHDNVIMNTHLTVLAHELAIPQCIFLSCAVGYPPEDRLVKETDIDEKKIHPTYRMGAYIKIMLEELCRFYGSRGRARFTVARHSNVYGPYDKFGGGGHFFAANIGRICDLKDGDTDTVWGPGTERRDFLYVSDLIKFIEKVIDKQDYAFDIFNVGLGRSYSVREVVEKMIQRSEKQIRIEQDISRPAMPTQPALDSTKAKDKFGWSPAVDLDEGIRLTMEWYRANRP